MLSGLVDKIVSIAPPRALVALFKIIPRGLVDWKKSLAFQEVVRYAYKNSAFYKEKFDELGINPRTVLKPSDLGDFYTTPEDIINHSEELLCRNPHMVFESSGTTGRNKRVYFTQDELAYIGKINAMGFFLWGIKQDDRIINAFDFSIWIPGTITQKGLEKGHFFSMAAGKVDPLEVYKRIPIYNFDVVIGEPTWLIKLTEMAEKEGSYPLKFIIAGAEEMPDSARPWIEKTWQGAKIRMVYASVESGGVIGCEFSQECGGYHIDENDFLVEIADAGEDGYGEVVFTTLSRRTMPLVRYRNRDVSKIIDEKCPCGLPYRRLAKMRGRTDEMVVASGGNLYPLMFEEIFKDIEGISSDWQIIFRLRDIKEVMEFNLELKENYSKDTVKEKVFSNIRLRYPDLWKNMSIGIFDTEFVYHPPKTLRSGNRKMLRMVDKRYVK